MELGPPRTLIAEYRNIESFNRIAEYERYKCRIKWVEIEIDRLRIKHKKRQKIDNGEKKERGVRKISFLSHLKVKINLKKSKIHFDKIKESMNELTNKWLD
jgi:phosphotransferase system IIB component